MNGAPGKVYVIDDDEAVRDALRMLFAGAGVPVETFASAPDFMEHAQPEAGSCLVLDIRMPGMSGLALQDELIRRSRRLPIVFITGHGDIPLAVQAVKKGAYDFIEKPFDDERLLRQVIGAMRSEPPGAATQLAALSEREREVLERVLEGKPSRQIAVELFISVKTVEFHRARLMAKLGVRSAAQLFRVCLGGN